MCGEFQFMQQWESENDLCNEIATNSFRDFAHRGEDRRYMFSLERQLRLSERRLVSGMVISLSVANSNLCSNGCLKMIFAMRLPRIVFKICT